MMAFFARLGLVSLAFFGVVPLASAADASSSPPAVLAYYTYDRGASQSLHAGAGAINQLATDLCSVTETGVVSGRGAGG